MIEYWRGCIPVGAMRPWPGRWTATVGRNEVGRFRVRVETCRIYGRLCALDVAHLLPDGCDAVVREWLESGAENLRKAALVAARGQDTAEWVMWDAASAARLTAAAAASLDPDRASRFAISAMRYASWPYSCDAQCEAVQRTHIDRLVWAAHGETLTMRERIELARDLRYRGEEEAAAAVLPRELKETM